MWDVLRGGGVTPWIDTRKGIADCLPEDDESTYEMNCIYIPSGWTLCIVNPPIILMIIT